VHTSIFEAKEGRCPICRRALVQVTAAVTWTCPDHPEVNELNPGRHAIDGRELVMKRERRPHGDHNPRHGGLFFMAADNTHHLEGTYPRHGVFRVFLYDEFTRPLPVRGISGRAVTRESFDPATHSSRELEAFALQPSSDGKYLEARLGSATLPVEVAAKVKFDARGPEQRFDFSFRAVTTEPTPAAATGGQPSTAASMPVAPATQPLPEPAATSATTAALLNDLSAQGDRVGALFQQGTYADMYFPALAAKEAALALGERASQLPQTRRADLADAVRRIVLAAWLVDLYGDLGNKPKLNEAYQALATGINDLKSAYATAR
jgi:hypothetical protein